MVLTQEDKLSGKLCKKEISVDIHCGGGLFSKKKKMQNTLIKYEALT